MSNQPLAASVGIGNLMMANWVLGDLCDGHEFGHRLAKAPFDCTVVVLSAAVAETSPIYSYLDDLSSMQWLPPREWPIGDSMADVLKEKTIYRLGENREHSVYVALNRAEIKSAKYEEKNCLL